LVELTVLNGGAFAASGNSGALVEIMGDRRHIAVTTPNAIWSYGAQLLLDHRLLSSNRDLLLRIDLWVVQGSVNIGVVGVDGQFIVHETRTRHDARTAVNLAVKSQDQPSQIIVRNAGPYAAKAVIERVQIYHQIENPFTEAASARAPTRVSSSSRPIGQALKGLSTSTVELGAEPVVSLILTVKNGLPHLDDALESVRRQSYRNIELVVQDCLSTDGSTERLERFTEVPVFTRREADNGIGDANNRALKRCRGAIVGSIDSDNLLDSEAIARAVEHFAANPNDAAVYGTVQSVSAQGEKNGIFRPGPFDFLRVVACELVVPWSTAFFNKVVCGESLLLDASLKTCADYDVWLRISHLPIAFVDYVQGSTRISDASMTCRPENYEQFCSDKAFALRRYAQSCAHEPLRDALIRHGLVGIYCWAAESVRSLSPESKMLIDDFYERAKEIDPTSSRLTLTARYLFESS